MVVAHGEAQRRQRAARATRPCARRAAPPRRGRPRRAIRSARARFPRRSRAPAISNSRFSRARRDRPEEEISPGASVDPALQTGQDRRFDHLRAALAPVLPGKEVVPGPDRRRRGQNGSLADAASARDSRPRRCADRGRRRGRGVRDRRRCRAARHSRCGAPVCSATKARSPISKVRWRKGSNSPEGRAVGAFGVGTQRKDQRLVLARRDDRGGEADRQRQSLLRRRMLLGKGHGASASKTFIRAPRRLQTQNWGDWRRAFRERAVGLTPIPSRKARPRSSRRRGRWPPPPRSCGPLGPASGRPA